MAVVHHVADRIGVMYLGRIVEMAGKQSLFARPEHPYTRMLLDAIPDLAMTGRPRSSVAGEVPNAIAPPPGCAFHPRCPHANERCRADVPLALPRRSGGTVACHAIQEGRIAPAAPVAPALPAGAGGV
jgi:peptide/nickel transport system ATP-binding protein